MAEWLSPLTVAHVVECKSPTIGDFLPKPAFHSYPTHCPDKTKVRLKRLYFYSEMAETSCEHSEKRRFKGSDQEPIQSNFISGPSHHTETRTQRTPSSISRHKLIAKWTNNE